MRIVFDENVPQIIASALRDLSVVDFSEHEITSIADLGKQGIPDTEVLHEVGKGGILITYDKDFKTQKALYQIIKQNGIGVFWIRQSKNQRMWDLVQLLVKHWPDIVQNAESTKKPFLMEVTKNGVELRFS